MSDSKGYKIRLNRKIALLDPSDPRYHGFIDAATRTVRNEIIEQMDPGPPRTGREYLVPGTETPYTASAPGEPPAIREGVYRDAWEVVPPVTVGKRVIGGVTNRLQTKSGAPLARILEEGTFGESGMGGARIAPRPHIRPGLRKARDKIMALLRRLR